MSDEEALQLLLKDIENRCGSVVAHCSRCNVQIQQKEKLVSHAQCPFCGRFLSRS